MQAIMETLFDIFYLTSVITLGILMASKNRLKSNIASLASWQFYWALVMPSISFPEPLPFGQRGWKTTPFLWAWAS